MNDKSICTDYDVEEVLKKYSDMVYKIALSQTKNKSNADDVFQEVFLRYVRNVTKFQSEEHKKAWLIRVTINCSRKLLSSAWFRHTVPLQDNIKIEAIEENEVYFAVLKLPLKYRTVIHLFYYEDMPIAEISKILGIKEGTIKSQLNRGRKILKENLKGDYNYV